jgi:hypothetical protein
MQAKDLVCKDRFIMSDLQRNEGCACLGRRTAAVVQNSYVQNKRQKFQNIDRMKAPAKGAGRRCPAISPGAT